MGLTFDSTFSFGYIFGFSYLTMKASIAAASVALSATLAAATPTLQARASGTSSTSLPTVTVKGNAFFAGNNRFYIRGVDYQPGGSSDAKDPLADEAGCMRDIKYFKQLGINTIRVYTVDNSVNHDTCMNALADAGIYVALDVNTPLYSLRRDKPAISYNAVYLQSLFATVDAFANYTNTLLFFSGNEVINDDTTTNCAPYIKAVTRDLKQYRNNRGYRAIPIGYSAADVSDNRYETAQYMNCGTDDQRSDFFAFNDYSWCDPSSFTISGWDQKVQTYNNYSLPLFLSEYGCNKGTRKFEEVSALYNSEMTGVYSGGLVYEYSEEGSDYGLVQISGDSVTPNDDFTYLQAAFSNNTAPSGDGGYKSSGTASTCPPASETWDTGDFTGEDLPAIPSDATKYMTSGAGKGPGLSGGGSQDAGSDTVSTASAGSGSATRTASGASSTGTGSASSSSTATGAASRVSMGELSFAPLVMTGLVALSTLLGATLL
ncbi:beta-glucanosyltransferase [Aureobasidium pullulans]|uniref:1,3-beta-glucanosyltransferase n=1 Tax=Aureobasidium pullulans TaxID=5580 RepID=A0A4S9U3B4_AURPU|nr:beta-glucanosyltransferase [Aureobasidium pullulans]